MGVSLDTILSKFPTKVEIVMRGGNDYVEISIPPDEITKNIIITGWVTASGQVDILLSFFNATEFARRQDEYGSQLLNCSVPREGVLRITNIAPEEWKDFRGKVLIY